MSLPNISSYGDYSSDNYGVNTLRVKLVNITLYYSYKTIVAYEDAKDGLVVRKNDWSTTTGKHLKFSRRCWLRHVLVIIFSPHTKW